MSSLPSFDGTGKTPRRGEVASRYDDEFVSLVFGNNGRIGRNDDVAGVGVDLSNTKLSQELFLSTLESSLESYKTTLSTVPAGKFDIAEEDASNERRENIRRKLIKHTLNEYVSACDRLRRNGTRRRLSDSRSPMYLRAMSTGSSSSSSPTNDTDDTISEGTSEERADPSTTTQKKKKATPQYYHPASNTPITSVPSVGQDEYYRYVESVQHSRREFLRARTYSNVTRALWGNVVIAVAKAAAWISSGSSAMMSETVHSLVDCGNQALLLIGLREMGQTADHRHPYGYGRGMYFWALVSALGTFWLGAGVSLRHSLEELVNPSLAETVVGSHVWAVLCFSFIVDGFVLSRTVAGVWETVPVRQRGSLRELLRRVADLRDPATVAVLLEDGAACLGVVMAASGLLLAATTDNPVYDGLAGVGVSGLLATMGLLLVRLNRRFLLGQAVDQEIVSGIDSILLQRRSIDGVHSVQSQWTGPDTFSYKAEVDFDGTFLAAKLMPRYQQEFERAASQGTLNQEDLRVLLSWYAEDVMRALESEIRHVEAEIRREYPGATYIELEPDSKDSDRFAIDDGAKAKTRKVEMNILNRYLKSLYKGVIKMPEEETSSGSGSGSASSGGVDADFDAMGESATRAKGKTTSNSGDWSVSTNESRKELFPDAETKWEKK